MELQLFTNALLYMVVSLGAGYLLRSVKDEDGNPRIKWYISGLIIGALCALANAVLVETIFGGGFKLDQVLGSFMRAQYKPCSQLRLKYPCTTQDWRNH